MEFEVLQKTYFEAYIIHLYGPTCFAVGEAKKGAMVKKGLKRAHSREMMF